MTAKLSIHPLAPTGDALSRHVSLVTALSSFIEPPTQWRELVSRLVTFRTRSATPLQDQLVTPVVRGGVDDERLAELHALATIEASPANPVLNAAVADAAHAALVELYAPPLRGDVYAAVSK